MRRRAFRFKNPIINVGPFITEEITGGTVMKSLLVESGVKKMLMMASAFLVGVVVLIALLEKLALILAYYFT